MAIHDQERRPARDYVRDARRRIEETSTGAKWTKILVGLALITFIVYMIFAAMNPSPTGEAIRQTPQSPQSTTTPRTTTVPSTTPANQPQ